MTDSLDPLKQTPPSRTSVKKIVDDFPAVKDAYRRDPSRDEKALAMHVEFARGYLETILNLPQNERDKWATEIDGLGSILSYGCGNTVTMKTTGSDLRGLRHKTSVLV